jgi:hypothetical protein
MSTEISDVNKLTPIVLFVYNRPFHTEKTLTALLKNTLADQSTLYIYCDGPKENAQFETIENIKKVRSIVRKIKWCKEVFIRESKTNLGLANSIKNGVSEILKLHGSVIVLEDDIVSSPFFLNYMNNALAYYIEKKSVFSISGYNLPSSIMRIPFDYEYDVYASIRNHSWGWATWSDRWSQIDWDVLSYSSISKNLNIQEALNRGGDDVYDLLQKQQCGKLNIWSIQFTIAHFVNHAITIFPIVSFVDNIGLDGTGENCNKSLTLRNEKLCQKEHIKFLDILYEDKRLINAFYSANCNKKRPIWQKIINRCSRIFGGERIFVIKKKIYT